MDYPRVVITDTSSTYCQMCEKALQAILGDALDDSSPEFYKWVSCAGDDPDTRKLRMATIELCQKYASNEQLRVGFAMETEYGKTWDGEQWIDLEAPKEPDVGIMESILIGIRNTETKNLRPIQIRMNCKHRSKLIDELKLMGRWETVDTTRLEIYGVPVSIDETVPNGHIAAIGQPTHIGDSL